MTDTRDTIHGLHVSREGDDVYGVHDACRRLGGVVRFWVPASNGAGTTKKFRAFGEDFLTLADAVKEYTKVRGVRLLD